MTTLSQTFSDNHGILRLAPAWVPRSFCIPGRRLKLHPDDTYALGMARGGIDERWLASTTPADNGPLTAPLEGLSQVVCHDQSRVTLPEAVQELGAGLLGQTFWKTYRGWPIYAKFFDNLGPLPHHIHQRDQHAKRCGKRGKPECYYFPPQLNNHGGRFPYTFFGLIPGTSREQLRACLESFTRGDNKITSLSQAYRLDPGTGWDVPAGLLHAPGSLCTYEPQAASDVFAMFQSLTDNQVVPEELLWKDSPPEEFGHLDYLLDLLDWDLNLDPDLARHRFMSPLPQLSPEESRDAGYQECNICYKSPAVSARELTVLPGRTVRVRNHGAYGLILLQGHGSLNRLPLETPTLIRFGQLTHDEYFVSAAAAAEGVEISNASQTEPLVMLKHFGPEA